MKLTFIGANHEVTGSCHYLEIGDKKALVDCGMEQGINLFANRDIPANPGDIDYLFLTHAHIDHSGKIPLLVKQGFAGKVFATTATCELAEIMLRDSAHIQEFEASWRNRKAERSGRGAFEPMYDMQDVERALKLFVPVDYNVMTEISDEISVCYRDAGHLLGSAFIEIYATEEVGGKKVQRTLLFSGDIGNPGKPIIREPEMPTKADIVVMESTYGNREHEPNPDYVGSLAEVLEDTFSRGGNVVIPSFAIGRTQELLYFLRIIKEQGLVPSKQDFQVYVDSPLAVEATHVFRRNVEECFDEKTRAMIDAGINPLQFPGLKTAVTTQESIAINDDPHAKVIISAAGMCNAGRIRHHLKYNLWREDSTILFVGYQSEGTLGRMLLDGVPTVKLFGEEIMVRARIRKLSGSSGHADRTGLLRWVNSIEKKPEKVYVVHGSPDSSEDFAKTLREEYGYDAMAPYSGTEVDLLTGEVLRLEAAIPLTEEAAEFSGTPMKEESIPYNGQDISEELIGDGDRRISGKRRIPKSQGGRTAATVYTRLENNGKRLLAVIKRAEGRPNKELAKFADALQALIDKYEK
ncbi:MAG: MBL fold metallo-hydrolase [Lachnospiraceae bacterium]|nr:MBL fold metallo-hydrolase [Lachnospiraceae bacterium]